MTTTNATIETLLATARTSRDNFRRVESNYAAPALVDMYEEVMEASLVALMRALAEPVGVEGRRVALSDGRTAELFPSGGGYTVAVRRPNGTTESCKTRPHASLAERDFAAVVALDAC